MAKYRPIESKKTKPISPATKMIPNGEEQILDNSLTEENVRK